MRHIQRDKEGDREREKEYGVRRGGGGGWEAGR